MSLLSTNNSKLKKSGKNLDLVFASFGLPAAITCPGASSCKVGCYALNGTYRFKGPRESRERNLEATKDVTKFIETISSEIAAIDSKHPTKILCVRIHDSGDYYSKAYLESWLTIAEAFPHVIFYSYTKSVHMFIGRKLPDNFRVVFSYGGKFDALIDSTAMPHAKVFETVEALKAAGYVDGSEDDATAIFGGRKIGLVYHGAKNYKNTEWSRVS